MLVLNLGFCYPNSTINYIFENCFIKNFFITYKRSRQFLMLFVLL